MVGSTELFTIVGIVALGAIILPIVLNENPTAFLENSLCTIFVGKPPIGNTTCNDIKGNVTFVGNFPIVITPNNTANTITWSITENNDTSHANIGGFARVFKNETAGIALFRTLTGGGGVSVTQFDDYIEIKTGGGGGGPKGICNIVTPNGTFNCDDFEDTVDFVGQGIAISNSSSIVFALNATLNDLNDVTIDDIDENDILIFNVTSQQFENQRIDNIFFVDRIFNAEEGTVDDVTGVDCVNDVTYIFADNTDPNEYRRHAIEFGPNCDVDDNFTWSWVVPHDYMGGLDFNFKLYWTDDNQASGSFIQTNVQDCEQRVVGGTSPFTAGRVTCTSSDLELHKEDPVDYNDYVAMRWTNVQIPNGATITSAKIQFEVDEVNPNQPLTVRFRGHAHDNSPALTETNFDISNRAETTAFVDWAVPHWVSVSDQGSAQLSADLSSIVQEIVNRAGWVQGNAMTIMIKDWPVNTGMRHAESLEGEAVNAPEIQVFYGVGGAGEPVCFEFSTLPVGNSEILDASFQARQTQCVGRSGADKLTVTNFLIDDVNHQFSPNDLVIFRIHRPNDFVPNDFEGNVFLIGGKLQWIN